MPPYSESVATLCTGEGVDSYGELPDVYGLPGVHLEIKRCEQLRLFDWMQQSIRDSKRFNDGFPVVIHRKNREPWLCTMLFSDWLELFSAWLKLYQQLNPTPLPSEPDNCPEMTARPHQLSQKPIFYRGCSMHPERSEK